MDIASSWGGGVDISVVASGIAAPGGQKLALNDTGDGVLVWYKDHGVQKLMAVGLAASRSGIAWMSDGYSKAWDISTLPNMSFSGQVTTNMTDAEIDTLSGSASNTAKLNTDIIVQALSEDLGSCAAAIYCRSVSIAGHACSCPNMNQLRRIYALRDVIDSLDPAASSNTVYKLSNWGFRASGASSYCWSSNECNGSSAWTVESSGLANPHDKLIAFGVIPILELDPVTLMPLSS